MSNAETRREATTTKPSVAAREAGLTQTDGDVAVQNANPKPRLKTNWNWVRGCTKCSPICRNCYAPACFYNRAGRKWRWALGIDVTTSPTQWNGTIHLGDLPLQPGQKQRAHTWDTLPESWKDPRFVFVNDLGDTFHQLVPDEFLDHAFDVMDATPRHTYRVITKRAQRMRGYLSRRYPGGVPPYIQPGVSVGCMADLASAIELVGIPVLGIRWLSMEPLIEAVTLPQEVLDGIGFVVLGGESGPQARPMKPEWARAIRDQLKAPGRNICLHFKQWGNIGPDGTFHRRKHWDGVDILDGRTWREFPDGQDWYEPEEMPRFRRKKRSTSN